MRVSRKAKAERVPVSLAVQVYRGRDDRALVPVADGQSPLAAADSATRPRRPTRRRGTVTGDESDRVVIEQSELEAAMAAIRLAFDGAAPSDGRSGLRR